MNGSETIRTKRAIKQNTDIPIWLENVKITFNAGRRPQSSKKVNHGNSLQFVTKNSQSFIKPWDLSRTLS